MNDSSSPAAAPPPAEPPDGVLAARDVTVRFGGLTALDEVSLTAQPRQVTGIIGPNGAGKTTLLNVLCGFVRPGSGELSLGTTRLTGLPPNRLAALGIARTLQGLGLFRGLTVLENVMTGATCQASTGFWAALLGLSRAGRDERALRTRALAALDRVGAAQADPAFPWPDEAADRGEQRGLAGPVRAEDGGDGARLDRQGDPPQCEHTAVAGDHAGDGEGRVSHRRPHHPRRARPNQWPRCPRRPRPRRPPRPGRRR